MGDWVTIAQEVTQAIDTATLATASTKGIPRAVTIGAELHEGVFDWRSLPTRQHSLQVKENPHIAFDFFDQITQRSVYGTGLVASIEKDEGEFLRYRAEVKELWVVIDDKVDGEYVPPQALDPKSI